MNLKTIALLIALLAGLPLLGCDFTATDNEAESPNGNAAGANGAADDLPPAEDEPLPSLQDILSERVRNFTETASAEVVAAFEEGVRAVEESGVLDSAMGVGDTAPDFELPAATGGTVHLNELLADGPVVLSWYRGGWCPYCRTQLSAYDDAMPRFSEHGASTIFLTPETVEHAAETLSENELDFIIATDTGNAIAEEYGLRYTLPNMVREIFEGRIMLPERNGDESWTLPLTATYVISQSGVITYAFVTADYRERAEPQAVLDALKALHRE